MKTKQDVFEYLLNLPRKISIPVRHEYDKPKRETIPFEDVIINSPITKFYRKMIAPKTSCRIPIPKCLSMDLYNKLDVLIKKCNKLESRILFQAYLRQIQCCVLYEDYFGLDLFKRDYKDCIHINTHELVKQIDDTLDIFYLCNQIYDVKHPLRSIVFFADCTNIVHIIEKEK